MRDALGKDLRFVYLRRRDVVAQAVSWARAEQTSYWQQGDERRAEPRVDLAQVDALVREVEDHNEAWQAWFVAHGVGPLQISYEALTTDPARTVSSVLQWIDVQPPVDWVAASPHRRQADDLSADWARRYRMIRKSRS